MDKPKPEVICGESGVVSDETGAPAMRLPSGWGGQALIQHIRTRFASHALPVIVLPVIVLPVIVL